MRVTGGSARGRSLLGPGRLPIRPTSDRVREALFDLLGARVPGAAFLDLCAGTGAVGLEALSRGARRAVLVESDHRAVDLIRRNLLRLDLPGEAEILASDVFRGVEALHRAGQEFGVVFLDPPYAAADLDDLRSSAALLVAADGILVVEHRTSAAAQDSVAAAALRRFRSYRHGDTTLTTYLRGPDAP